MINRHKPKLLTLNRYFTAASDLLRFTKDIALTPIVANTNFHFVAIMQLQSVSLTHDLSPTKKGKGKVL